MSTEIENVKKAKELYQKHIRNIALQAFAEEQGNEGINKVLNDEGMIDLYTETASVIYEEAGVFAGDPTLKEILSRITIIDTIASGRMVNPAFAMFSEINIVAARKAGIAGEIIVRLSEGQTKILKMVAAMNAKRQEKKTETETK